MSHPSFAAIDHRPFPLPTGRWRYAQVWSDLAFLHWPVSARWLRTKIPLGLEIDEFEGRAWIGVVPFRLRIRRRGLPSLPRLQVFPEINVRTYVSAGGRPGVWFFSLDAPSPPAVWAARRWFHLPYERARFEVSVPDLPRCGRAAAASAPNNAAPNNTAPADRVDPDLATNCPTNPEKRDPPRATAMVEFRSTRVSGPPASFAGRYRPTGPVTLARPGTLDHFLTERYCLYAEDRSGHLFRGNVHHVPWPLQRAEVEIEENTMTAPLGLALDDPPEHVTFAQRIDVSTWPLERVTETR